MEPRYRILPGTWGDLREIDRLQGALDVRPLPPARMERAREEALLEEAVHTTRIEGSEITSEEAARAFESGAVPTARPEDVRELLNYRAAHVQAMEYAASGRPVTQAVIREIHRMLVRDVRGGAAAPGEYRRVQNYVVNGLTGAVIYTPPPANEVPERMAALTDWLRSEEGHPVLIAGIAQLELVDIHPFLDGNGRTARLLTLACLRRAGYSFPELFSLSEFYEADRPGYYDAIQQVRDGGGDHSGWLAYFAAGVRTQLARAIDRIVWRPHLDDGSRRPLTLNERRILDETLAHGAVSIRSLSLALPSVPRRTLQYALRRLVDAGLLVAAGETQTRRYLPGPALGGR